MAKKKQDPEEESQAAPPEPGAEPPVDPPPDTEEPPEAAPPTGPEPPAAEAAGPGLVMLCAPPDMERIGLGNVEYHVTDGKVGCLPEHVGPLMRHGFRQEAS